MKPLNFDNSPCSPISSNCVIWGGPDLKCINLCKGDSITDVVEKIALELCTILDTLNISSYDLTCFSLANCSPQTFTDLINFLIVKVCELENVTPTSGGGTTPSGGCPTDCFVTVSPCFVVGSATTMNLTNYVTAIGTKICDLVDTIALQQLSINSIDNRVTVLENTLPPSYTTPTMTMLETLPSTPPLLINTIQPINIVIESFINDIWFSYVNITGDSGCLANAVSLQTVLPTDFSKVNPTAIMSAQYAGLWVAPALTVCDTIKNIWASIKDLRDAPLQSPFNLFGTTTDAGNDKTTEIERYNSIHTIGSDSYFNSVKIGLGNGNVATNTVVGFEAGVSNITGYKNSFVGYQSGNGNTVGNFNSFFGEQSGQNNTTGSLNVFIGRASGKNNTTGQENTFIGEGSGLFNGGSFGVFVGTSAGSDSTGDSNVFIGHRSGVNNTSGNNNTTLGTSSLLNNTTGANNISIGFSSGALTSALISNVNSLDCIYIGSNIKSATIADTNQIVIGTSAIGNGTNTTTIGNIASTDFYLHGDMNLKNTTAVTTASVSQTDYLPITINGVAYKLLLAV